jgi:hypothetical protein
MTVTTARTSVFKDTTPKLNGVNCTRNEPDECYYTEWEDDDHYFEVDMEFVKFLFCTFNMDDVFNIAFQIGTDWYDLRYDLPNNDVIVKCKNKIVHREKIFE